jgi:hypothetical protein
MLPSGESETRAVILISGAAIAVIIVALGLYAHGWFSMLLQLAKWGRPNDHFDQKLTLAQSTGDRDRCARQR